MIELAKNLINLNIEKSIDFYERNLRENNISKQKTNI